MANESGSESKRGGGSTIKSNTKSKGRSLVGSKYKKVKVPF